ncbi:phosphatase PAP2 family protein [Streptomyces physcomitrii]|uniref:Phosphatase PAP2 family protein n=1 Tax=Streptomyces physcomitrii TaxID=2724184 RepID=A0ABX1H3J4_9ACTN|nr:phosphatase PAP2 family protein [Streptomyces physcomitrii]NKI41925.1 phosphatase PAP2 family protein [Streptomyces physcomitrii]
MSSASLFALLSVGVIATGGGPLPLEAAVHRLATEHRPGPLVTVFRAVTDTGTAVFPYVVALAAGAIAAPALDPDRRRMGAAGPATGALAFAAWLALGQELRFGLMASFARPRPARQDWLVHASRWSFPSGHTTSSAMAAGLLVLALLLRRPPGHRWWAGLALVWAAAVGASRVWLGVHWAGDVAAGWCLALAWTGLATLILTRHGRIAPARKPPADRHPGGRTAP